MNNSLEVNFCILLCYFIPLSNHKQIKKLKFSNRRAFINKEYEQVSVFHVIENKEQTRNQGVVDKTSQSLTDCCSY